MTYNVNEFKRILNIIACERLETLKGVDLYKARNKQAAAEIAYENHLNRPNPPKGALKAGSGFWRWEAFDIYYEICPKEICGLLEIDDYNRCLDNSKNKISIFFDIYPNEQLIIIDYNKILEFDREFPKANFLECIPLNPNIRWSYLTETERLYASKTKFFDIKDTHIPDIKDIGVIDYYYADDDDLDDGVLSEYRKFIGYSINKLVWNDLNNEV